MNLIRALFPKWNFFDQVGHHFQLQFRFEENSEWQKVSFDCDRPPLGLFFNPIGNLALAQNHILENFAQNPDDNQLVQKLLRFKLSEQKIQSGSVQYRVLALSEVQITEVYKSAWLRVDML